MHTLLALLFVTTQAPPVALPDVHTDAGLLTRLLLAESIGPSHRDYKVDDVRKGMQAMRAAIDNRLKNDPAQFGAPKATGYVDIVGAKDQFFGFSKGNDSKIALSPELDKRMSAIVSAANTGKDAKYAEHVNLAIEVAKAPVVDPFAGVKLIDKTETTGGSYAWRVGGSKSPDGKYVLIPRDQGGFLAGNQFYTLKK